MKLTIFIMTVFLLQVSASSNAQISLKEDKASLRKVLKSISKQSGYDFIYSVQDLDKAMPVTVNLENADITRVLEICFAGQPLIYQLSNKTVMVKVKQVKVIDIRGKVIDTNGEPLMGVVVKVKGGSQVAFTDKEGNFLLKNIGEKEIIQFSFVGFETLDIAAKPQLGTITLKIRNVKLDEVVVVGYGTVRKGDLTGSVSSLKPDAIEASQALSVESILQGKLAGVSVSASNPTPGAALSVTIRGANSLRGDSQPLYVIDNIPQASTGEIPPSALGGGDFQIAHNPLTNLNPSDIEDIQVLKDASATAIYGSRGANGVILITTKKGTSGKTQVSGNANYTIVQATNLRDMISLDQYAIYRNERNGSGVAAQFYKVGDEMRYVFSGVTYNADEPGTYTVIKERNWQKEIYRPSLSQNYDATLSGGNNALKYFISANVAAIKGMIPRTGIDQQGLRLNLNGDITKKLRFTISLSGNLKTTNMMTGGNSKGGSTGSTARTAIDAAPYEIPPNDPMLKTNEEARTTTLAWISDYDDIGTEQSARIATDLFWQISKKFSYNLRTGGNLSIGERARWYGGNLSLGVINNGYLGLGTVNSNNYTVENLVNFNHSIQNLVDISATLGATYDDYNFLSKSISAINFQFKDLRTKGMHIAGTINQQQPYQSDYQLLSFLGRINLSFLKGRYIATITGRSDGSSKFRSGNRSSFFPAIALAWKLEQEKFIKDLVWIDQLKLRVGYGKTGSQSISPYNSFYNYNQAIDYASPTGEKQLAIAVTNLQNRDLRWETTSSYNAGIDLSLFKGRLQGTAETYYKETNDLLIDKGLPTSTSFTSIIINQGALSNRGYEFSLNGEVLKNKNFKWTLAANIGFNRSKIIDMDYAEALYGNELYKAYLGNSIGDHLGVSNIYIVGKQPGLFWGYKTNGIIQMEDTNLPTPSIFIQTPGNIKVVDVTGDGKIDGNDKTIIGNPNPDFNYGFQTAFTYKNFRLSAMFYGVHGNQIVNGNARYEQTPSLTTGNLTKKAFENRWTPTNPSNLYPSTLSTLQLVMYDRYVEDGSFLRMSDVTVNYTVPSKVFNKKIQGLNLFASVKNVFVLTNYTGYDPEMRTFAFDGIRRGVDANSFSNPRQFVVGVNVTF